MEEMLEAAKVNQGRIMFAYSDIKTENGRKLAEVLEVTEEGLPILAAMLPKNKNKALKCPTAPEDLTSVIITTYLNDILSGAFEPVLKSQPIEANDEPLKVIVGKNFK